MQERARADAVMVRLRRRLAVAALAGLMAFSGMATSATAITQDTNPIPVIHDTGGSGGGSTVTTGSGDCSYFANPGRFGGACGKVTITPVHVILHDGAAPTCWDEIITQTELHYYGYVETQDSAPYYIHSCITGNINQSASAHNQPDMQINQQIITIPLRSPNCTLPFTDDKKGHCIMTLTQYQQDFVTATAGGSIPSIVVTTHPSTTVRTNEMTGFADVALDQNDHPIGAMTQRYVIGGVAMWATMDPGGFKIYPYGPPPPGAHPTCYSGLPTHIPTQVSNGTCESCDGLANLDASSTPANTPQACWWSYPKSSHGQGNGTESETYDFRAEADWTVWTDDGGGPQQFAHFAKYDDLALPVFDVQSLNYG